VWRVVGRIIALEVWDLRGGVTVFTLVVVRCGVDGIARFGIELAQRRSSFT